MLIVTTSYNVAIVGAFDPSLKGNQVLLSNSNNTANDPILGNHGLAVSVASVPAATSSVYFEFSIDSGTQMDVRVGISNEADLTGSNLNSPLGDFDSVAWSGGDGGNDVIRNGSIVTNNIGSWNVGDIIGVIIDNDTIRFYKNGSPQGASSSNITGIGTVRAAVSLGVDDVTVSLNVGASPFTYPLLSGISSFDGSQSAEIFTSLDPNFTHVETQLSNIDLTLTSISATVGWRSSYSILGYSSGFHYYEVTRDVAFSNIGGSTTRDINNRPGGTGSNVGLEIHTGSIYKNNSVIGTVQTIALGEVIGVFINSNNNTIRFTNGTGVLSTAYDLNAGTNYAGLSVLGGSSSAVTANFGRTPFTHTMFPEFNSWDDQTTPTGSEVILNMNNTSSLVEVADLQLTIQKNVSVNAWRSAYSATGKTTGKHYFEVLVKEYNRMFIGVTQTRNLNTFVGTESNSSGYNAQAGSLYTNGVFISNAASTPVGNVVGVLYDGDSGNVLYTFDGISFTTPQSVAAGTYYPGMTIYNDGSQSSGTINFGGSAFTHTLPVGYSSWDGSQ